MRFYEVTSWSFVNLDDPYCQRGLGNARRKLPSSELDLSVDVIITSSDIKYIIEWFVIELGECFSFQDISYGDIHIS